MRHTTTLLLLSLLLLTALSAHADEPFSRVSSIDELTENAEYLIAAQGYNNPRFFVCGTGFVGIDCGTSPTEELMPPKGALIFSLIYEGDHLVLAQQGQYISTKSGKSALELSDTRYTAWQLSHSDGGFLLRDGSKCLRIYSYQTKASLFGLYSAVSQEASLVIYKRDLPVEQMQSYTRLLRANTYETLMLPFAATLSDAQTKAYTVSRSGNKLTYTEVTSLAAHTPYIITRASAGLLRLHSAGTSSADRPQDNALIGTLTPLRTSDALVLDGKEFVPAAPNCLIPAFRAYLPLNP